LKEGTNYLAYSFLYDDAEDLRTDYEICVDGIACQIGVLKAHVQEKELQEELTKVLTLVFHMNSSLRVKTAVTKEELNWLHELTEKYRETTNHHGIRFVLPQGDVAAAYAHVLRNKCLKLARLMHRYEAQGNKVDPLLYDFANLLSNYFFLLALQINLLRNVPEIDFQSRNYKQFNR
jgi:cob(I)alamin adenosyltransferase